MTNKRTLSNLQIAKLLRSVAAALELSGTDNHFKVVAYSRAADAIEHASSEVKDLWDSGKLSLLSGVGSSISASLDELFKTGRVKHFDQILDVYPPALFELLGVPGIGPKRALKLVQGLGITKAKTAISQLEKAAKKGRVRVLEGMGEESERDILQGIAEYRGRSRRMLLDVATTIAESIIEWMEKHPLVRRADPLGSLRRQVSTIGDVDISVASDHPKEVIEHFKKYPYKSRVLEAGTHTASLILPNEYQIDLMVQPEDSYGSLLQHFTGSKHHNVSLREYALKKGYSLSEYGIKIAGQVKKFDDEKEFYNFLGLDWIPPELREGESEIELARMKRLPQLVELKDIKGDLQLHSNIDIHTSHDMGKSSIEEMAKVAEELGYQYIGITDHNPAVKNNSEKEIIELIKNRTHIINEFNNSDKSTIYVFNGLEIDIQPEGKRALPDQALELLDYACVSIHSSFRQDRKIATQRVLRALDHPKVKFWAHPTGRLLGEREGIDVDWDQIFDFCVKNDKWLEIDGWPNRLDLPDFLVQQAVKNGVKIVVDTDAHAAEQMPFMRYGVSVARRGWSTAADIINTCPLDKIRANFR